MQHQNWKCPKCDHTDFETDEFRATGGISRFFDIQNKKFTTVICSRCNYTEIYRADSSTIGNIFDFFTS